VGNTTGLGENDGLLCEQHGADARRTSAMVTITRPPRRTTLKLRERSRAHRY